MNLRTWTCTRFPHHEVAIKYSSEHPEVLPAFRAMIVFVIIEVQNMFGRRVFLECASLSLKDALLCFLRHGSSMGGRPS